MLILKPSLIYINTIQKIHIEKLKSMKIYDFIKNIINYSQYSTVWNIEVFFTIVQQYINEKRYLFIFCHFLQSNLVIKL